MIALEPFKLEHIEQMRVHPSQARSLSVYATDEYRDALAGSLSYTLRVNGEIALCGGVMDLYEDRGVGHLWSLFGELAPRHMRAVHGVVARFISVSGKRALVATTECASACRWLRLLGFKFDHTEEDFAGTGTAHAVYVRVI